jgi:deazaflavin-dependent oxidoreductase (nitroreductase family)
VGLAEELSYTIAPPNVIQRSVKAIVSTRPGSRVLSWVLPPLDRTLTRVSEGRTSAPKLLVGVPVLTLTSTGRRSGLPRETQLVGIPVGGTLAVLGTNFARPETPAWVHNLEADPRATVSHRGTTVYVMARPASEQERTDVLAASASVYSGYLKYLERISGRDVRIFVLEMPPSE